MVVPLTMMQMTCLTYSTTWTDASQGLVLQGGIVAVAQTCACQPHSQGDSPSSLGLTTAQVQAGVAWWRCGLAAAVTGPIMFFHCALCWASGDRRSCCCPCCTKRSAPDVVWGSTIWFSGAGAVKHHRLGF